MSAFKVRLAGIAFLPTDRPKGICFARRAIDEDSDSRRLR